MIDIFDLLATARGRASSDLHLIAGGPALFRVHGLLRSEEGAPSLTPDDTEHFLVQLTSEEERKEFYHCFELDFGYTVTGVGRVRCNAALQRGSISMVIRLLPPTIPTIEQLSLPEVCKDLVLLRRGLVVVSGPTGSGKSTTLAAMLNHLNHTESRRVVTIEDPVEYMYTNIKCAVTQREVGSDTLSFAEALRRVLRQDPDVILVGEMRDPETASAALTIAETGHLVLTTGHAPSAYQAIERIIDLFPPHERNLAQTRLASLLQAVLCQALVPRADGSGRVAAIEIMLANPAVRNLIRDGRIYQLPNTIRTNARTGMQLLDEALINLFRKGVIEHSTLLDFCNDKEEVTKLTSGSQENSAFASF